MPAAIKKKQEERKKNDSNSNQNRRYNEETVALTAMQGFVANASSWIADSAATHHMCCDHTAFSSIELLEDGPPIRGVSGSTHAQGMGTVELRLEIDGGHRNITLTDVYFVPDMGLNLFSIGTAETKGITVEIGKGILRLKDKTERMLGHAQRAGKLYYLQASMTRHNQLKQEQAMPAIQNNKISRVTWHRRLGHIGDTNLEKVSKNPGINGLDLRGLTKKPIHLCGACMKANQKTQPSTQPQQRAKEVAELIHIDVVGPITPKGFKGSLWYVVFTDDYTRWRYVCNMKTKGQAQDEVKRFINMVYTQMDRTIKRVRIDNGTEFGGGPFIEWLRGHGIGYESAVPYGHEQNGVAERSNGLLAAKARAMILDSRVQKTLWPEAVKTACYLLNRLPTSALKNNKVPLQQLYESLNEDGTADPIDLGHLRSFGCTAYVHIPTETRRQGSKFDARSNEGILVGYEGRNQYRIWLPDKGKDGRVVRARDVKFDEGPAIYDLTSDRIGDITEDTVDTVEQSTEQGGVGNRTPHSPPMPPPQPPPPLSPYKSPYKPLLNAPTSPPYESPYAPITDTSRFKEFEEEAEDEEAEDEESEGDVNELPPTIDMPTEPRRSVRQRKPPSKFVGFSFQAVVALPAVHDAFLDAANSAEVRKTTENESSGGEPETYKEAVTNDDSKQWKQAMDSEYKSLQTNSTWDLVKLPPNRRALRGKWVFRYKRGPDGSIERHKARWVVKGFEQRFGIDYKETFAAVVKSMTYKVIFAIVAFYDFELEQMDVKTAFLNGTLKEVVYVVQPTGYEKEKEEGKVCRLKKALYGLKQAPRRWYEVMHHFLISFGYTRLHTDNSVFRNGNLIVAIYVDDILLCGPKKDEIQDLKAKLSSQFEMTDCGPCKHYLGMLIERNRVQRTLTLSQKTYLTGVLKDFGLQNAKAVTTPMEPGTGK